MTIGFIGAGRVGCTLGKYLSEHGVDIAGFYSRTRESADMAATFTQSETFSDIEDLVQNSEIIFITTPDGSIKYVWEEIRKFDISKKIICHFSGSLSSDIFSGIEQTGAYGCSVHPMYAFSSKFSSYEKFNTACLSVEGCEPALKVIYGIFREKCGHRIFKLDTDKKVQYHAAAAMASNCMIGLLEASVSLLQECGFNEEDAWTLLSPLAVGNVNAAVEKGTKASLTGPVERNDTGTVRKHREVLKGTKYDDIYASLGKILISIAEEKNTSVDYTEMCRVMEGI